MSDYIRCPICLFTMRKDAAWSDDIDLQCVGCERTFKLRDALSGTGDDNAPVAEEGGNPDGVTLKAYVIFGVLMAIACLLTVVKGASMTGPWFLFFYGVMVFLVMVGQWFVRVNWRETSTVRVLAAVLIVGVGVTRFVHAYFYLDMRKFLFLAVMAVIGVALQFLSSGGGGFGGRLGGGGSLVGSCSSTGGFGGAGCGGGCGGGGCGGCGS